MKKHIMILAASTVVFSAMAQETNEFSPRRERENHPDRREQVEKRQEKDQQRRLQFLERELKRMGITEEEKAQITALQKIHKEKMKANAHRTAIAREKLTQLLDEGVSMEALEVAIQNVSAAQTEQLRILVGNRIEMERILGKEKHAQFMQKARTQFQKHGRRSAPPLPPRPGLPPIPGQQESRRPAPPHQPETPSYPEN